MPDFRLSAKALPFDGTLNWLVDPIAGIDETQSLATAVLVALNTDRRARPDDVLPQLPVPGQIPDRRGWWGDMDAAEIWKAWPVGCRLWLLRRAKITDSSARGGAAIERARRYIAEALDPFVQAKIFSRYRTDLAQTGQDRIEGTVTIYRGPEDNIVLEFQDLWTELGG